MELHIELAGIGKVVLSADDEKEIIRQATFWTSLPPQCPVCGSSVTIYHRKVKSTTAETYGKEFDYYRLRCAGEPVHEATLGQYQTGVGLFYRGPSSWQEVTWERDDEQGGEQHAPPARQQPPRQPAPQRAAEPARAQAAVGADSVAFENGMRMAYGYDGQKLLNLARRALKRNLNGLADLTAADMGAVEAECKRSVEAMGRPFAEPDGAAANGGPA